MRIKKWMMVCCSVALAFGSRYVLAQTQKPRVEHAEIGFDFKPGLTREAFISEEIRAPIEHAAPFLAIGVVWTADAREGGNVKITLRGSADGKLWTDWRDINQDHDSTTRAGEFIGALSLFDRRTRFVQYRVEPESGHSPGMTSLRLVFISPGATPSPMREAIEERSRQVMSVENLPPSTNYPKPPVVTRTEWGCPDGQITTHGTLSYTTVTHLIVHHTATGNEAPSNDWAAVVRSIWNFHIFTNGWADIGYNYLVDPNGVIYEGRAGGDNVLGAHFSSVNAGTMGVSMLGTFTEVTPAAKAMASLRKILSWKADQRGLDPEGASLHAASGLNLKTISGHRDGPGSTECPGDVFYPLLPAIRADVKNLLLTIGAVTSVSAASFKPGALAGDSIVAAFGTELASATQVASSTPLPTALGGTSVTVRDSLNNEKLAPLFFVSPGQINYLLPAGLASGLASVIVANGEGRIAAGAVTIAPVAPALFSASANGQGLAAAVVFRVKANGQQVYGSILPEIDLDPETDMVFLLVYGTGIRGHNGLSSVTAVIGGLNIEVLFAGPVEGLVGLDQVNLRLPRALKGRGEVDLQLVVDGQPTNVLKLRFK